MNSIDTVAKAKTGIWGLDDILAGGFTRGHLFLMEGACLFDERIAQTRDRIS